MFKFATCKVPVLCIGCRDYALCCPRPKPPSCGCVPVTPVVRRPILKPDCGTTPIAPNPCCPRFHYGHDTFKFHRNLFFFVMLPVILAQAFIVYGLPPPPHKEECRDYEFMRRRTKRFPWGDGDKTFFHNDHLNSLASECTPAPPICD